jgi:hypothetical protein
MATSKPPKSSETRDPEEIERDIAETRQAIDETVDELGQRLAPSQLVDDAKSYVKESAVRGVHGLRSRMSDNAVPLALIGGGIVWMMSSRRRDQYAYDDDYDQERGYQSDWESSSHGGMRERAGELASRTTDRAREMTGRFRDRGAELRGRARERAREGMSRARHGFDTMRTDQPLLLALAALAAGALIGGALPSTRREDELLGSVRDTAIGKAAEAGKEKVEQVKQAAERTVRETREGQQGRGQQQRQQPTPPMAPGI